VHAAVMDRFVQDLVAAVGQARGAGTHGEQGAYGTVE